MSRRRTSLVAPLAAAVSCAAFAGPAIARPIDAGPAAAPSSTPSSAPAVLRTPAPARAPRDLLEQRRAHSHIAGGRLAIPRHPSRAAPAPSDSSTPSAPIIVGAALAALIALAVGAAAARRPRAARTTSA